MRALVLLSLLWVSCVWGHHGEDHHDHHPLPGPIPPPTEKPTSTSPRTAPSNPGTAPSSPGTAEGNSERAAEVDDAVRDKRQWFPPNYSYEDFLRDYPRGWPGREGNLRPWMDRETYWRLWARYWRPDIPMSELIRYQRLMEERWQHNEWLWDQWRRYRALRYPDSRSALDDDPRSALPSTRSSLVSPGPDSRNLSGPRNLPRPDFLPRYPGPYPDAEAPWRRPSRPYY